MSNKIQRTIKRSEELFSSSERQNNENLWSELAEFMLNNQYDFNQNMTASKGIDSTSASVTAGGKKTRRLYDSTALQSVHDLAAAFQSTLTNPATEWSKLRFKDEELNNNAEAVSWLEKANKAIHDRYNESNFNTEMGKAYNSFVALNNLAIFHESREDETGNFNGYRFTSLHLSKVAWAENAEGLVDTVYRKFRITARQANERWPESITDDMRKALENEPEKEFEILHAIFPRDKEDIELNEVGLAPPNKRPIASMYITEESVLEDGGYYEMPIYVARWDLISGERYGRGPSLLALPDVRTLNRLKQRGLEAIDLQVQPPLLINQRDVFGPLDLRAGGFSVVKDHNGIKQFQYQARTDVLQFSTTDLQESIRRSFFLDKIQPLATLQKKERMSQLEVVKRLEEMQSVLGPVLSRLNFELLQPLLIRSFRMLLRAQQLPEVPEIILETNPEFEIIFDNQLARAQKVQDVSNIQQWVQNLAMLAQVAPEVMDNVNVDGIARHTAKVLGVPEIAVQNEDIVEQTRMSRQQQQEQAVALDSANKVADISAKTGE